MSNFKNVQPLDDFNWEEFEQGTNAGVSKEDLEKAYDETLNKVTEHQVVEGTVISVDKKEVIVNIGYKSDGIIPASEFRYNPDLKVGDKVEVYVENQEDTKGQLVLSHKKARLSKSWERVNAALENEEIIQGYIKCRTKGGMIVDVFGIEAFLPGSQIDVHPIRDYDVFVGKTMEFKVVKINQEFRNVVVSHKALIEQELEQQRKEIIGKLEKGQILEGTVKNITTYGVFVDLGGVDGLIHITDLSWGRVSDPHEVVSLDQKINVVILDFDEEKKRIALGLKQLTPHPWDALDPNLKVGDHVKGKVVVMADYGAFVEIAPGVEGLIHVSEMSWSQHLRSANDFMKVGDDVEAVILTLDRAERKMSLGIKQLKADPWECIETKFPIGSKHVAKVRNFTNFGIFVELEEGVDGLIHVSEMSWSQHLRSANDFMKVGDEVEAVILTLDRAERKMSLGIKQLKEDPWETIDTKFPVGSKHVAKVRNFTNFGIFVELEEGVDGLIHISDLSWTKKIKHPSEFTTVGATLDVVVLEIDKENRRLSLGHKQLEKNPWDEYEAIYTPGSVHTGKIIEMMDKGAVVALNEGGEGFATPKHLTKADGSMAKKGEELDFKVIEFVKETKRIILSHSRTFEEGKDEPVSKPSHKRSNNGGRKNDTPVINNVAAGTSLGDIDALAKLKAQMEGKA